jgi:hypothetical protein
MVGTTESEHLALLAPCWPNRARRIVVDFVGTLVVECGEFRVSLGARRDPQRFQPLEESRGV